MSSYKLGITCCFCGGSLEVDEASHTARCTHCSSILRIARDSGVRGYRISDDSQMREVKFMIERHLKDSGEPLVSRWGDVKRVYLPFWRVNATAFTTIDRSKAIEYDHIDLKDEIEDDSPKMEVKIATKDVTFCGNDKFVWGIESLGIRTQVIRLTPLDREFYESNHPVELTADIQQAMERFDRTVKSTATAVSTMGSKAYVSTVAPECMLIYFPIWIAEVTNRSGRYVIQFDPIAKRVVSMMQGELSTPPAETAQVCGCESIRITPHRCPNCGRDLPECGESVAYYCENCGRLFTYGGLDYRQLELRIPTCIDKDCRLFPFWIFDLANSTWSDRDALFQALNLVGFSQDRFYVPAFTITNPSRLLRLVAHYNRLRDEMAFGGRSEGRHAFADVSLSADTAACLISPIAAATKVIKGYGLFDMETTGPIEMPDPELVWLPYALDRYFWREQITGAAIERAAVRV